MNIEDEIVTDTQPLDYQTLPLELFTVKDLTDAVGVARAAEILGTTERVIYTVRNTNSLSSDRMLLLINAVQQDEATYRQKLVIKRNIKKTRVETQARVDRYITEPSL